MSIVEQLMQTHLHRMLRKAVIWVDDIGTAEDCVADAFIAVHIAVERGQLDEPEAAAAYLNTCVTNSAMSVLRKRRTARSRAHLLLLDDVPPAEVTALAALDDQAKQQAVTAAVDRLPERERQIIVMRYYEKLPVAEIAATLGIAEGTVKRAASDARAKLAKALGHLDD